MAYSKASMDSDKLWCKKQKSFFCNSRFSQRARLVLHSTPICDM
jgi:hypothetical protein